MEDIESLELLEMNFVHFVKRYIMDNDNSLDHIKQFLVPELNINKKLFYDSDFREKLHPLMYIVYIYTGYTNISRIKVTMLIQLLIDHGVDINLKSDALKNDGYSSCTPLLWLLEYGDEDNYEMIELLLENGANPFIQNEEDTILFAMNDGFKYLIHKYRGFHRIQSRHRGNLTRRKMRTLKAKQMSSLAKSQDSIQGMTGQDLDLNIYKKLSGLITNMAYNPEVNRRMLEEQYEQDEQDEQDDPYTEWLQDRSQLGSGKRSKRRSKSQKIR